MKSIIFTICLLSIMTFVASAQNEYPSPRKGHTLVTIDGEIYMFGGEEIVQNPKSEPGIKSVLVNSAHKFDPPTKNWKKILAPYEPTSKYPDPRSKHAAAVYRKKMYVFGGAIGDGDIKLKNDLWEYDPGSNKWMEIYYKVNKIEPRKNHAMGIHGNSIYIMGGENENGDMPWSYEVDMDTWEAKSIGKLPDECGKVGASMVIEHNNIILAGGLVNGLETNAIWCYNIEEKYWFCMPGDKPFSFVGTNSNYLLGNFSQNKPKVDQTSADTQIPNMLYSLEFTPPASANMQMISDKMPSGDFYNSFTEYVAVDENFNLNFTFYFWGGNDNNTFYSYKLATEEGAADTLSVYNPDESDWEVAGIQTINYHPDISIYPIPAEQTLFIRSGEAQLKSIKIFDIHGLEVMSLDKNVTNEIQIKHLVSGIYYIQIETESQKTTLRFIKR